MDKKSTTEYRLYDECPTFTHQPARQTGIYLFCPLANRRVRVDLPGTDFQYTRSLSVCQPSRNMQAADRLKSKKGSTQISGVERKSVEPP